MSENAVNMYDVEIHVGEIYDQVETQTDDIEFLLSFLENRKGLRILEPFCGTGRILIPLAQAGHTVVGIDQSACMLDRARAKVAELSVDVASRITLIDADVTDGQWPSGFDLVVLGSNCFYDLATPAEQEGCVRSAASSLFFSGSVFVDNDHMEGELAASWQKRGLRQSFPTGMCLDGSRVESEVEAVWWDAARRLIKFRRITTVVLPNGSVVVNEFEQQKHPVSTNEVRTWLEGQGFVVQRLCGDYRGSPYTAASERAIFWAEKV